MTNNPGIPVGSLQESRTTPRNPRATPAPAPASPADHPHVFAMQFTSTPRGARLARHLAAGRLDVWGVPYGTDAHDVIVLIVAELVANAMRHGHVPGRDFHLRMALVPAESAGVPSPAAPGTPASGTVRVEVTDTRTECVPPRPAIVAAEPVAHLAEWGRGLFLVTRLAARWDWHLCPGGPGKTVWAECELPES